MSKDCDIPTTQLPIESDLPENQPTQNRGSQNAAGNERQQQFQDDEDEGVIPKLLINTYSHNQP